MLTFVRNWIMPIAMLFGCILYPWLSLLAPYTPFLIFAMLLLTFCKISPRDLKLQVWHLWLLLIQLFGSIGVYLLVVPFHPIVAQGAMVCMLCPTATAAAVITSKLGGNMASVTTYTLLANIGTAIAVPLLFPVVEPHADISFYQSFLVIFSKVFPLLIFPFLLSCLIRVFLPPAPQWLFLHSGFAFFLSWISLFIFSSCSSGLVFFLSGLFVCSFISMSLSVYAPFCL